MSPRRPPSATPHFESVDELLDFLGPVMRAIATAVGPHCEVVLHDLTRGDLGKSIAAIENGHVTGRKVGGPSTNLGIGVLQDGTVDHNDFGYRGRTTDGRELHSSSVYFRNSCGNVIAALCVNVDLTPAQIAASALRELLPDVSTYVPEKEVVAPDISSILDGMIDEAIASNGKAVPLMERADRVEVMQFLNERGAFHVKRAVEQVARRLGVSRVTAYSDLDEARRPS